MNLRKDHYRVADDDVSDADDDASARCNVVAVDIVDTAAVIV